MLVIEDAIWDKILPNLKEQCPNLTASDLAESERRVDLLTAKIQNRHWCNKQTAQRTVLKLLQDAGVEL